MSDQGKPDDISLTVKGHTIRVKFETAAMVAIFAIVVGACLVGFWSKDMADRVVQLKDSITDFLGVLAATVGGSWARGHMDKRVDQ